MYIFKFFQTSKFKIDIPFSLLIKTASYIMSIKENKQHLTDSQTFNHERKTHIIFNKYNNFNTYTTKCLFYEWC